MTDDAGLVEGTFSLFAMVHTMPFDAGGGPEPTRPWDGADGPAGAGTGPFSYASRPCHAQAPINNLSTDLPALGGAVPGARVPSSTRTHPMTFEVRAGTEGGPPRLVGSIRLTVCQLRPGSTDEADLVPDTARDGIDVAWEAEVGARRPGLAVWRGTFEIVGGRGRYEPLRGDGDIAGYFFCFDPEGCEVPGALCDGQYAMIGRYRFRRPPLPGR